MRRRRRRVWLRRPGRGGRTAEALKGRTRRQRKMRGISSNPIPPQATALAPVFVKVPLVASSLQYTVRASCKDTGSLDLLMVQVSMTQCSLLSSHTEKPGKISKMVRTTRRIASGIIERACHVVVCFWSSSVGSMIERPNFMNPHRLAVHTVA
ncbi:hypothetical protein BDN72DRAFT_473249 [Pluteus cervinus]|uniref:Uncharacterized protein n=1 Tax=Pluteus cervinus TaxID=181527 RepID=A0ACD3A8T4_9AGAR|nr:hypothetical protein BDN72DRAFT_473249 [Pluteus cervinus]